MIGFWIELAIILLGFGAAALLFFGLKTVCAAADACTADGACTASAVWLSAVSGAAVAAPPPTGRDNARGSSTVISGRLASRLTCGTFSPI